MMNFQDNQTSDLKYDGWKQAQSTITFTGNTANSIGDHDGTSDPFTIFSVTGDVLFKLLAVCTTTLQGASAIIAVGDTNNTASIIATTTASNIAAGELWHDATPDAGVEAATVSAEKIIVNGQDILGSIAVANITAGVIRFNCLWKPISRDGLVEGV